VVNCKCAPSSRKCRRKVKQKRNESAEVCLRLVNEVALNKHSPVVDYKSNKNINEPDSIGLTDLSSSTNTNVLEGTDVKRLRLMEEILKYLKMMVSKRDEEDDENEVVNEWRHVAQVMDRFLFWTFLSTTTAATVFMMVVVPIVHYGGLGL
jgi:hypothetical protein